MKRTCCHEWSDGRWSCADGLSRWVMWRGFCPVCGAELRPDGTSGPAAAELSARLAAAEKRGREYANAYTVKTLVCDDLMLQINHLLCRIRELDRRLAAAEQDTRRLDALEKAEADTRRLDALEAGAVRGISTWHEEGELQFWNARKFGSDNIMADTLRALADALEVDAQ